MNVPQKNKKQEEQYKKYIMQNWCPNVQKPDVAPKRFHRNSSQHRVSPSTFNVKTKNIHLT